VTAGGGPGRGCGGGGWGGGGGGGWLVNGVRGCLRGPRTAEDSSPIEGNLRYHALPTEGKFFWLNCSSGEANTAETCLRMLPEVGVEASVRALQTEPGRWALQKLNVGKHVVLKKAPEEMFKRVK